MGLRYRKRDRMERVGRLPDEVLASLGTDDIKFENFDEQLICDKVNAKLDIQSAKLKY